MGRVGRGCRLLSSPVRLALHRETENPMDASQRSPQLPLTSVAKAPLCLPPWVLKPLCWLAKPRGWAWFPREQGKWASPPASLCSNSLGWRCRGQACSEPAGRLPHASPATWGQTAELLLSVGVCLPVRAKAPDTHQQPPPSCPCQSLV